MQRAASTMRGMEQAGLPSLGTQGPVDVRAYNMESEEEYCSSLACVFRTVQELHDGPSTLPASPHHTLAGRTNWLFFFLFCFSQT